jgi:hypothetical protein
MIHYHGTPITPESDAATILNGRHAMVSFEDVRQIGLVSDICQSFAVDNGAFSAWKQKRKVNWAEYADWVTEWCRHPGFDWALIPDVIDGNEAANDDLLDWWKGRGLDCGVPVWHLHESIGRLEVLASNWDRVAIGSSGEYASIGTHKWWNRMSEAMGAITCNGGKPAVKLHGLRMLNTQVFVRFPFASADSTNVARCMGLDNRWNGTYRPATNAARGVVLADRIEAYQSAPVWKGQGIQEGLFL